MAARFPIGNFHDTVRPKAEAEAEAEPKLRIEKAEVSIAASLAGPGGLITTLINCKPPPGIEKQIEG